VVTKIAKKSNRVAPTGSDIILAGEYPQLARIADEVLALAVERAYSQTLPQSTYRLQLNSGLTFRDATALVPYWNSLGVTHIYTSPFLKAGAGTIHGYDVVDYTSLNPEIGDDKDFEAYVSRLKASNMGQIVDWVPNHMGIASDENAWWRDVLECGGGSPYAEYFDIDWKPRKPDLANKVLLPVLAEQYGRELESGQLTLHFTKGAFFIHYLQRRFPVAPQSYSRILGHRLDELEQLLGKDDPHLLEYQSILTAIAHLPSRDETDQEKLAEGHREKDIIKRRLQNLCDESPIVADFINRNVEVFNGRAEDPASFDLLDDLLNDQAYRLSFWRVAADEINYRRFFDVNELAAVCMENPRVFSASHERIFAWMAAGKIDGLRIDHADGLFDPTEYLRQLQEMRFRQLCQQSLEELQTVRQIAAGGESGLTSAEAIERELWKSLERKLQERFLAARSKQGSDLLRPLYCVVEKILGPSESLPDDWPVHGTTGYDFLNEVNGLFVDQANSRTVDAVYSRFIGRKLNYNDVVYSSKKLIMKVALASELQGLGHQLDRISEQTRWSRDFTLNGLTFALREVIACFPIYRTYITSKGITERDRQYIEQAVARAKRRNAAISHATFDFIRDVLLQRFFDQATERQQQAILRFIGRFQQFTGPTMAKAVEDCAFYLYNRLVSLNEVGGSPALFGSTVDAFHYKNRERQATRPYGLLATSTHDTKRSEDVRARINVLSEIPAEWKSRVFRWARWNKRLKTKVDGELAPDRNDEYLLYQTLIGTWPFQGSGDSSFDSYIDRIQKYMTKAMREAKAHTSWIAPYEPYEQAVHDFVSNMLKEKAGNPFRADFEPLAARIARCGLWNSLSQTVLKLTSPGVPDLYQGTEIWDFSLVDPDNRRPVDYGRCQEMLSELLSRAAGGESSETLVQELVADPLDGRLKMFVISIMLRLRRDHPSWFTQGEYLPLDVTGIWRDKLCAFARCDSDRVAVVAVPRLVAGLTGLSGDPPLGELIWADTRIALPDRAAGSRFRNVFTGEVVMPPDVPNQMLPVSALFRSIPVAVLENT
jgi:(1->4)-alpha-D-glucan 1-alpha-D-glucosylmutase